MRVYKGRGLGDFYYMLIRDVAKFGREVTIRGKRCLELKEPVTFVYNEPGYCWMNIPGRKFNPFFALAEIVWILSGNGNVEWISYFNSNMRSFADPGNEDFHGSYGKRIRRWSAPRNFSDTNPGQGCWKQEIDQISWVVQKLSEDPYSRQAVISLWDPYLDNYFKSKDHVCNNLAYYSLRDGVVDQTVVIRSNDLVWGTPVNAIQWTHIQAYIAGLLYALPGKLTYVIQNLHYYLDEYKPTLGLLIDRAFSGEKLEAERMEGFCPLSQEGLDFLMDSVEYVLGNKEGPNLRPELVSSWVWNPGYWSIIPRAVWVYVLIKEHLPSWKGDLQVLAEVISNFPAPLPALISDFYSDSKNEVAIEALRLAVGL